MTQQQKKGFTIIEVVLVLAIAGLIFLMVFIALPALQRSQRDQSRKNDVSTVAAAVNSYRSSNRSSLSGMNSDKLQAYIDRLDQYEVTNVSAGSNRTVSVTNDTVQVVTGAKCPSTAFDPSNDSSVLVQLDSGAARAAAVVTLLENNGSKKVVYCQDA